MNRTISSNDKNRVPQQEGAHKRSVSSRRITISKDLKQHLRKIKSHLKFLADPLKAQNKADGIYAVMDDNNNAIPGVLRYGANRKGPSVAILGGIHMNEMAGISALLEFHKRWQKGVRPKSGNIFVATGDIERALEFIDTALKSDSMSATKWGTFSATKDHFNYNRIAFDVIKKKHLSVYERRAQQIVKHVLMHTGGNILDIHNTSTPAPPMITIFMKKGETPQNSITRIKQTGVTNNLPISKIIVWQAGPYNEKESIRSLSAVQKGKLPILIEAGGSADPRSFERANLYAQLWLKNVKNMCPSRSAIRSGSKKITRAHYIETGALYHPAVRPQDYSHLDPSTLEKAKKDTFVLVRDLKSLKNIVGWSKKAKATIKELKANELDGDRLDNFMPIRNKGIIAIGLKTGLKIAAPEKGYLLMVGNNPFVKPTFNETFANISIKLP